MLFGYHPVAQALMGTFFTWFVTAMGAATVVLLELSSDEAFKAKFLDGMLGFAAGVMLAASYWSLLAPGKVACSTTRQAGSSRQAVVVALKRRQVRTGRPRLLLLRCCRLARRGGAQISVFC